MLRTVFGACRRAYTCTCLSKTSVWTKPLASLSSHEYVTGHGAPLHTSPSLSALNKELKGKKNTIRIAQSFKMEQSEDASPEDEEDLSGLTDAGITIPTLETHSQLIDGVPFSELPICHIKSSLNNTLMLITDHKGSPITRNSCGMEGFKHVKKSTNVAAQATGLSLGLKAAKRGITNVRVVVKGLGAGRLASIKGLQMAGMRIVSITDQTPLPFIGQRPRKIRRL